MRSALFQSLPDSAHLFYQHRRQLSFYGKICDCAHSGYAGQSDQSVGAFRFGCCWIDQDVDVLILGPYCL